MKKPHPQLAKAEQAFYSKFFFIWCLPVRSCRHVGMRTSLLQRKVHCLPLLEDAARRTLMPSSSQPALACCCNENSAVSGPT